MKTFIFEKIETLEIAEFDLPEKLDWEEAEKACKSLGKDWRMPSKDEFYKLFLTYYTQGKGNFKPNGSYWLRDFNTMAILGDQFMHYAGYELDTRLEKHNVRAIRTLKTVIVPPAQRS